jgi:hypothetical protein
MDRALIAFFLTLRFVVELLLLWAIGYWAFMLPSLFLARVICAVLAVGIVATVWGVFVSPKARFRLSEQARLAVELCIVAVAVIALRATGRALPALLLAAAAVCSAIGNSILRRNRQQTPA